MSFPADEWRKFAKSEQAIIREMNELMGPMKYEGMTAPSGVEIKEWKNPPQPYRCHWHD